MKTGVFSVENVVCIFVPFENHKANNKTFLTWTAMSFQMIRRSKVVYFYIASNCFLSTFVHRVEQSTAHLFFMKLFLKLEHFGWNCWFEINWKINIKYQSQMKPHCLKIKQILSLWRNIALKVLELINWKTPDTSLEKNYHIHFVAIWLQIKSGSSSVERVFVLMMT